MTDHGRVPLTTLIKVASAVVHYQEFASEGGAGVDKETADRLMEQPDVAELMNSMRRDGLLPVRRDGT